VKEAEAQEKAAAEAEAKAKEAGNSEEEIADARADAFKSFANDVRELEQSAAQLNGYLALAHGDYASAVVLLEKAGVDSMQLACAQHLAGKSDLAIETARRYVAGHPGEVQPLAHWVDLLWRCGRRDEAASAFAELREISAFVDVDSPVFERLGPIAAELGYPADWGQVERTPDDVGDRPELDTLGPFRWRPSPAPAWVLKDAEGSDYDSARRLYGKPHVVIFYLGYGCLHCAEQLQAFAPMAEAFADAGLPLVAVSTDDQAGLRKSLASYGSEDFPFPLFSDDKLDVFKAYRAYDDFEEIPLHGTFLVDAEGLVRWHDISYEPFMDPQFVLNEWRRQAALTAGVHRPTGP
jgi:peroxiredoxin